MVNADADTIVESIINAFSGNDVSINQNQDAENEGGIGSFFSSIGNFLRSLFDR